MKQLVETQFRESVSSYLSALDTMERYTDEYERIVLNPPEQRRQKLKTEMAALGYGVNPTDEISASLDQQLTRVEDKIYSGLKGVAKSTIESTSTLIELWAIAIQAYSGYDPRKLSSQELTNLQPKPQYRDLTVTQGFIETRRDLPVVTLDEVREGI